MKNKISSENSTGKTTVQRLLALVLALLLMSVSCMATSVTDDAIDGQPTRSDAFFNSYSITLGKLSSTAFRISFNVTARETAAVLGCTTYDVQKKVDGVWVVDGNDIDGSTGLNTASHSFADSYACEAGYKYRVKAKYYCRKNDGSSKTVTYTSGTISM